MRPKNLAGLIGSAVLIAGLVMHFAPSTLPLVHPVSAASRTISLVANYPYWNTSNPAITVTKGDTVTISLSKTDAYTHQFLVDFDKDGAGDTSDCGTTDQCSGMFSSTPPPVGPFTVTANPFTYTYYCTVHYTYMTGNFVVQGQTSSSGDFGISSNPTSLTIDQGASGTTTLTLNSLNGFSGTVGLTASVSPSGPQPSLSPTSVTLSAGGSASSTLTVSTASSGYYSNPVPQGTYTVTVTASNGTLSHPTSVSLTVGSTSTPPSGNSNLPVLPIIGGIIGAIVIVGLAVFLIKRKK